MDFALSKVCLRAAGVDMSGFGAPALTAMATPDPASVTSVPDKIFPCLRNVSMPARLRISTSARSPASMRATSIGAVPQVTAKPAAILLFEFSEQFFGGAAHADAAVNA